MTQDNSFEAYLIERRGKIERAIVDIQNSLDVLHTGEAAAEFAGRHAQLETIASAITEEYVNLNRWRARHAEISRILFVYSS